MTTTPTASQRAEPTHFDTDRARRAGRSAEPAAPARPSADAAREPAQRRAPRWSVPTDPPAV